MLEVLGVISVLHEHHKVLIILEIIIKLNDVLVLHYVLDVALLLSLHNLILVQKHLFLNELFHDLLITPLTDTLDQRYYRGRQFHRVNLVHLFVLGQHAVLTRVKLYVENVMSSLRGRRMLARRWLHNDVGSS